MTLHAKWTAIAYTVSFNANGGTGTMADQSRTYDDGVALTANAFLQDGCDFTGWATTASGEKVYDDCQVANIRNTAGTQTLYAKWNGRSYTINFSGCTRNPISATCGNVVAIEAPASKSFYRFAGWKCVIAAGDEGKAKWGTSDSTVTSDMTSNTVAKGSTPSSTLYFRNLTTTDNGSVTLVAKWERISYQLTLTDSVSSDVVESSAISTPDTSFDNFNPTSGEDETIAISNWNNPIPKVSPGSTVKVYAGLTYTVTSTFADNITTNKIAVLKKWGTHETASGSGGVYVVSHTFGDSEDATQSWSPTVHYVTVTVAADQGQSTTPVVTCSYGGGESVRGYYVTLSTGETSALEFDKWHIGSNDYTDNPHPIQVVDPQEGASGDIAVGVYFKFKRMTVTCGVDSLSYAAFGKEMTGRTITAEVYQSGGSGSGSSSISIPYGSDVYFRCTISGAATEDPLKFAGWYREGYSSAEGTESTFLVTNVTSNITLKVRLSALISVYKVIDEGSTGASGSISLNGVTYSGQVATARQVIGSAFSINATPLNEITVFDNWYDNSDSSFSDPLEYTQSQDNIVLEGTHSIKARFLNANQIYYVAFHNYNNDAQQISASLGQITVSSTSAVEITKEEYAAHFDDEAEDVPDGVFYKFNGTQRASIGIVKTGNLDFDRLSRRKYGQSQASDYDLTTETVCTVIVNRDYIYTAKWGTKKYTFVKSSIRSGDGAKSEGRTEVGSGAYEIGGDGTYSRGGFEIGRIADVNAYPNNGWKFEGWYEHWSANGGFADKIEGAGAKYTFTVPALFSRDTSYTAGNLVSYSSGTGDILLYRCIANHPAASWDDDHFEQVVFYAKFVQESVALYKWEGGQANKTLVWKSKVYALSKPTNLSSVRVDSTGYTATVASATVNPLSVRVSSFSSPDNSEATPIALTIRDQGMRRLPAKRPERYFQVEVENCHEVDAVIIGTSGEGIAK